MKRIEIQSQEEFDKIKTVAADEEVIFRADKIKINCVLEVYGILRLAGAINCNRWEGRYILAWASSQVHNEARASSQVHNEAWESSQVHNEAWASSQVHNVAWESSQVHNEAWESSQVHNVAWASSQVHNEAWESSQVHNVARDHSVLTLLGNVTDLILKGFSVAVIPFSLKIKIQKSKTAVIHRYKIEPDFFKRNEIPVKNGVCVLFKRVSKDFHTREGLNNETVWPVGTTLDHPNWNPCEQECGSGKFHACDIPAACDEFRYEKLDDKYIAVKVKKSDTYQWQNPDYPHKIAFRKGTVLYECDRNGKKIEKIEITNEKQRRIL